MRKKNNFIPLIIMIVLVLGLSVGFAAFSSSFKIKYGSTKVTPDESDFSVVVSPTTSTYLGDMSKLTMSGKATAGRVDTSTYTGVTGLTATLNAPGDTATWTFYVHNESEHYDAYLNEIEFTGGENGFITCTPITGSSAASVASACNSIDVSININGALYDLSDATTSGNKELGYVEVSNHMLSRTMYGSGNTYEQVVVTLKYASSGAKADGDFKIAIGDIYLKYSTQDYN